MFVEREEPEQLFGLFHSAEIYVATKGFTSLTDLCFSLWKTAAQSVCFSCFMTRVSSLHHFFKETAVISLLLLYFENWSYRNVFFYSTVSRNQLFTFAG